MIVHPIPPVFDQNSKVLILGSFPSVKSRESNFFYGHPKNRFWEVLSGLQGVKTPQTIEEKKEFLLKHNVAVWDVISSCEINGSADSSIKNVIANDLTTILNNSQVKFIFANGKTAKKYYDKLIYPKVGINAEYLPSTSPANAGCSLDKLKREWRKVFYQSGHN